MPDRRQHVVSGAVGLGAAGAAILLYQIGSGIMARATGEYVKLPDRVGIMEGQMVRLVEWMAEDKAEKKAMKEAASIKATDDDRKLMWKERIDSEQKRDARLEKILAAISECRGTILTDGKATK